MSDNKPDPPSTPEEITKKLEEFFRSQFGGNVLFTSFRQPSGEETQAQASEPPAVEDAKDEDESWLDFRYKPADIKAHLDRYVIRQDEAKKVLATAVCDHYNHARILRELRKKDPRAADEVEFATVRDAMRSAASTLSTRLIWPAPTARTAPSRTNTLAFDRTCFTTRQAIRSARSSSSVGTR